MGDSSTLLSPYEHGGLDKRHELTFHYSDQHARRTNRIFLANVLQGCFLSLLLLNLFLNEAPSLAKTINGAKIGGELIDKLAYEYDIEKINSQDKLL